MLGLLPNWVTFALGLLLIGVGIAAGEPVPIILGPLFLILAAIRSLGVESRNGREAGGGQGLRDPARGRIRGAARLNRRC